MYLTCVYATTNCIGEFGFMVIKFVFLLYDLSFFFLVFLCLLLFCICFLWPINVFINSFYTDTKSDSDSNEQLNGFDLVILGFNWVLDLVCITLFYCVYVLLLSY